MFSVSNCTAFLFFLSFVFIPLIFFNFVICFFMGSFSLITTDNNGYIPIVTKVTSDKSKLHNKIKRIHIRTDLTSVNIHSSEHHINCHMIKCTSP